MNNDRFLELLAKRKSGAMTLYEKRELDVYLEAHTDDALIVSMVDEVFDIDFNFHGQYSPESLKAPLKRLNEKIDRNKKPVQESFRLRFWLKVAAVLTICSAAYLILINSLPDSKPIHSPNIVSTKKGSKSNIILPDGTRVWINGDTKLSYNEKAWERMREVELSGEAYFDVIEDSKRPFIVHTKVMDVKVTGTAFNIRAYPGEKSSETTLLRGSVEVYLKKKKSEKILLAAHEKLVIHNNYVQNGLPDSTTSTNEAAIQLLTIKVDPLDSSTRETQWIKNEFIFNKESFEDIIPVLERRFNTRIELQKKIKSERKFSGTFEDDSLKDMLETFKFSLGFEYKIYKDKVVIY